MKRLSSLLLETYTLTPQERSLEGMRGKRLRLGLKTLVNGNGVIAKYVFIDIDNVSRNCNANAPIVASVINCAALTLQSTEPMTYCRKLIQ